MRFIGNANWFAEQERRADLAVQDSGFRAAAALIDFDHTADTGRREEAFDRLAIESKRFGLDPMVVGTILQDMYPDLKNIMPPPHDGLTK